EAAAVALKLDGIGENGGRVEVVIIQAAGEDQLEVHIGFGKQPGRHGAAADKAIDLFVVGDARRGFQKIGIGKGIVRIVAVGIRKELGKRGRTGQGNAHGGAGVVVVEKAAVGRCVDEIGGQGGFQPGVEPVVEI